MKESARKEKLKELRQTRKETVRRAQEMVKEQQQIIRSIRSALEDGPLSIPEIAEQAQMKTWDVMWYVASLRKYGSIVEDAKSGDYITYALTLGDKENQT